LRDINIIYVVDQVT